MNCRDDDDECSWKRESERGGGQDDEDLVQWRTPYVKRKCIASTSLTVFLSHIFFTPLRPQDRSRECRQHNHQLTPRKRNKKKKKGDKEIRMMVWFVLRLRYYQSSSSFEYFMTRKFSTDWYKWVCINMWIDLLTRKILSYFFGKKLSKINN